MSNTLTKLKTQQEHVEGVIQSCYENFGPDHIVKAWPSLAILELTKQLAIANDLRMTDKDRIRANRICSPYLTNLEDLLFGANCGEEEEEVKAE